MKTTSHILFLLFACCFGISSQNEQRKSAHRSHSSQQSDDHVTPENIELRFTVDNEPVALSLTRSNSVPDNPTTVISRHNRLTYWTAPANTKLTAYVNEETKTSIVVESRQDSDGQILKRFRGNFQHGDGMYSIEPWIGVKPVGRDEDIDYSSRVDIEGAQHVVSRINIQARRAVRSGTRHARSVDNSETSRIENVRVSDDIESSLDEMLEKIRSTRQGKTHYIVELLIVLDLAIYKRWFNMSQATNDHDKNEEAIGLIRHYFTQVASGIDIRYATIGEPDFSIRVHLASFYIATTPQDSLWTEDPSLKIMYKGEAYSNMYKGLERMEKWVEEITPIFTSFDHAVLFTGNNLYDGKLQANGAPSTKSGLADIEGVCQINRRVSINFEFGQYSSIQTGAHELGHNLGSQHDGGGNECQSSSQFVMATAPAELTSAIFKNPLYFSPCSIRYFRNYLGKLTSTGKNCLLTQNATSLTIDNIYPGMVYSADVQCEHFYGQGSYFCAGDIYAQTICSKLQCWLPLLKFCFASSEQRAYVGTVCANKKWCMKGDCIADNRAAAANDTCSYGDIRSPVYVDDVTPKMSCSEAGKLHPWKCYEDTFSKECCVSCPQVRKTDKPGCEFGDRSPAYCKRGRKADCYEERFRQTCCATCASWKTAIAGCEYGDKASWCNTIKEPAWQCYTQNSMCCETCQTFKKPIANCEYGDKVTWCATAGLTPQRCTPSDLGDQCCGSCSKLAPGGVIPTSAPPAGANPNCPSGDNPGMCANVQPFQCYQVAQYCCVTCPKYKTTIAGCDYGDKAPWCSGYVKGPNECKRADIKGQCCGSCSKYRSYSDNDDQTNAVARVSSTKDCYKHSDEELLKMCKSSEHKKECLRCLPDLLFRLLIADVNLDFPGN